MNCLLFTGHWRTIALPWPTEERLADGACSLPSPMRAGSVPHFGTLTPILMHALSAKDRKIKWCSISRPSLTAGATARIPHAFRIDDPIQTVCTLDVEDCPGDSML